ncbi:hypothetical protein [Methylobacterium fujisawaense]|uniref:hypothetical protein n=1 Tax=Methylobacterium fujisawaense TaxID=107400 RepID=UPI002448B3F4|nr:hypothetical protein [Methylobacterium fujisawaense]MDH3031058.1 hypothetical protein [Methylobacterium fujisawaense]
MDNAQSDAAELRGEFEEVIRLLTELDAGEHIADPDEPMHKFNGILTDISRGPVENEDHLQILRRGIDHILADPASPHGSVPDALDEALQEAILEAQTPLQGALLALARYAIKTNCLDLLRARTH